MSSPSETAPAQSDALATEHRTAAVVYNPVKVHLPTLKRTVAKYEREAGWRETLWFETTEADPGGGMARAALDAGADVVAAAGGDGTVRAVAEVVHGSDAALALLPSGTGNLLARNMKLPLDDLGASAHMIFSGHDRPIDFGLLRLERPDGAREEFGFLVMAGLGLDARMLANTRPGLKKRVGWLAYVDSLFRSLRDIDGFDFRYRLDESTTKSVRGHSVIVGNCGMLQANAMLLPEAEIDDGVFDIVVMRPRGFFGWVRIGARIFWENAILRWFRRSSLGNTIVGRRIVSRAKQERPLRYLRGSEFVLRLEKPDEFEIDGDPVGEISAFRARIDPGSLRVRVPAPSDAPTRGRKRG
ncbi:diacylglycerol kinase family protein [Curtobacterium sp. PhB136]|uniref:diacylglycerol/lipid kinase family protein n=1 Tax=Curtobacterium sp. PhB136 TaxID=2485181 RepID=UPI0010509C05|nr:diacylglycerol kinase family protein [Curtobacterium sp. PhB136]TCK64425.1 diacylglycerol kinase family enzyme [Curtobacterium sp. PhB136]